jgi:predicted Holliday junction resolvase-like endonuclease
MSLTTEFELFLKTMIKQQEPENNSTNSNVFEKANAANYLDPKLGTEVNSQPDPVDWCPLKDLSTTYNLDQLSVRYILRKAKVPYNKFFLQTFVSRSEFQKAYQAVMVQKNNSVVKKSVNAKNRLLEKNKLASQAELILKENELLQAQVLQLKAQMEFLVNESKSKTILEQLETPPSIQTTEAPDSTSSSPSVVLGLVAKHLAPIFNEATKAVAKHLAPIFNEATRTNRYKF